MARLIPMILAALIVTTGMSGCTTEADSQSPWCPEMKQRAKELPGGSFARQALSDCEITDDELLQALNNYNTCMADHGYSVDFEFEGGKFVRSKYLSGFDEETEHQCSLDYLMDVQVYYNSLRDNPRQY